MSLHRYVVYYYQTYTAQHGSFRFFSHYLPLIYKLAGQHILRCLSIIYELDINEKTQNLNLKIDHKR